ncbi:hypothetical protein FKP32DRAFT_1668132 [Trametes sanguinea]|nr:hypothetical protein FKP32DRAFT_1668132 [Trametes sanguinea]
MQDAASLSETRGTASREGDTQSNPDISLEKGKPANSVGESAQDGVQEDNDPSSQPQSPAIERPPSPTALSESSSSSSSGDMPSSYTTTPSGDILHPLKIKGWSTRKSKWISRFRRATEVPKELRLITWNVDFMARDTAGRLERILSYLQETQLSHSPPPSCILLQELDAWSFNAVLLNPWVRQHYAVTPPTVNQWRSHYGNATLVSRSIPVESAQMLVFSDSTMGRTAIFVDIPLRSPRSNRVRIVRIANTHLESLPYGAPARRKQLAAIADLLRADSVDAGVVGGDMNMIGDAADQSIHIAAGLEDACRCPDDPSAHTWGYQPPTRYSPGRLDRIFYVGRALRVDAVEVIGKGLRMGDGRWASDHCGLSTTVSF